MEQARGDVRRREAAEFEVGVALDPQLLAEAAGRHHAADEADKQEADGREAQVRQVAAHVRNGGDRQAAGNWAYDRDAPRREVETPRQQDRADNDNHRTWQAGGEKLQPQQSQGETDGERDGEPVDFSGALGELDKGPDQA